MKIIQIQMNRNDGFHGGYKNYEFGIDINEESELDESVYIDFKNRRQFHVLNDEYKKINYEN